jgi:hypothetical protein
MIHDQEGDKDQEPQNEYARQVKKHKKSTYNKTLRQFKNLQTHYIITSRFSNSTWNENINYRKKKEEFKCVYCSPYNVSQSIKPNSIMFVLEMNNDTNKILGIGMVRNKVKRPYKYSVYQNMKYNRFNYMGSYRIDRSECNVEEMMLFKYFDNVCFHGNKHMKRGQGLTLFPMSTVYEWKEKMNLVDYIRSMFKKRIND